MSQPAVLPGPALPVAKPTPASWRAVGDLCALAGRRGLFVNTSLAIVQALLPVAGLLAMQHLIDAVADGLSGRQPRDVATNAALLATGIAALVALAGNFVRSCAAVVSETFGRKLSDACAARVQQHAAELDLAEFDRVSFHELLHRAGAEAGPRPVRLVQDLTALGIAGLSLLAMACLLAGQQPWLPLAVGLSAAPIAWARRRHARLRFAWHQANVVPQRDVGYLGAVMTGRATAKDVRVLGLAASFGARLAQLRQSLRQALQRLARQRARDELFVHTLASCGLFGAYVYLALAALDGQMTLGGLVLLAQAAQRVQGGVRDLLGAASGVHEHRLFLRPLVDFLGRRRTLVAANPAAEPAAGALGLTATNLGFRYPDAPQPTLRGLEFTITAGERIAIVGKNGSGKSTLVKLLARLYDPEAGELRANDVPLTRVPPELWRRRLAVLLQDAATFELSLRDNLALGPGAAVADERLWQALRIVGLAEAVRRLPNGLDTPWSRRHEGGAEWSGGEARRLALARTLAQGADLLLLDEPFAALDGAAATALATALQSWPRTVTLVVVDHRAVALTVVDRVLFLVDGALADIGSPAAVAARQPDFRELFPEFVVH